MKLQRSPISIAVFIVVLLMVITMISTCAINSAEAHDKQSNSVFTYQIDLTKVKQQCVGDHDGGLTCHFFIWQPQYGGWQNAGTEVYNKNGVKSIDTFSLNDKKAKGAVYTNKDLN